MEYGDYYLVRTSEIKKLSKLKAKSREQIKKLGKLTGRKERWVPIPIHVKGKRILSVCFGENDEAGISVDVSGIEGSVDKAATALDVDPKKLAKALESEDMEKLAKLVGFDILPITPSDIERGDDDGYDE